MKIIAPMGRYARWGCFVRVWAVCCEGVLNHSFKPSHSVHTSDASDSASCLYAYVCAVYSSTSVCGELYKQVNKVSNGWPMYCI